MKELGRSAVESKFKVAVEEIVIAYYIVEADNYADARENYAEGYVDSSKPKQEEVVWIKEIV